MSMVVENLNDCGEVCSVIFLDARSDYRDLYTRKVKVATMTHDHDDTPHAILTLFVVPVGK